jgi:hypothetical protein
MAQRSVVDQVVGGVKTEATKRPVLIEPSQRICLPGIEPWVQPTRGLRLRDQPAAGRQETCPAAGLVVEGDAVPYPTRGHATSVSPSAWADTRSGAPTRLCYRRMAKT